MTPVQHMVYSSWEETLILRLPFCFQYRCGCHKNNKPLFRKKILPGELLYSTAAWVWAMLLPIPAISITA
ncbi:MAG: hypothetical protein IPO53_14955 [Chitinophagaceae bacterium]|nr:hypothetical protein [Chitinophagaceae bacterium]